jgi:hypothetical protein
LFVNLYFSSRQFKDYNWTDFYGDARPVTLSDLQKQTRDHVFASYGFDGEFLATLRFTLSQRCAAGFTRENPGLPIDFRDYVLSKLFEFIFEAIVMRFDFTDPDGQLGQKLEAFLDTIVDPDAAAFGFDWKKFYTDLRHLTYGIYGTVERLSLYLPQVPRRESLSGKELKVLEALGEADFRRLSNPELQNSHKAELNRLFDSSRGEEVRSCLNRIRRKMGFPRSESFRKKS